MKFSIKDLLSKYDRIQCIQMQCMASFFKFPNGKWLDKFLTNLSCVKLKWKRSIYLHIRHADSSEKKQHL